MRSANQSCGRYSFVVRAARGHSDAIGDRRGSGNKEMDAVRHWGLVLWSGDPVWQRSCVQREHSADLDSGAPRRGKCPVDAPQSGAGREAEPRYHSIKGTRSGLTCNIGASLGNFDSFPLTSPLARRRTATGASRVAAVGEKGADLF